MSRRRNLIVNAQPTRNSLLSSDQDIECGISFRRGQPVVAEIVDLTDYAVQFRYPGVLQDPDKDEAARAIVKARRFYEEIGALLARSDAPPAEDGPG